MHLPTASQISCSITMGLGERGKLHCASDVQSRNITVNGIFQICVCVCRMWAWPLWVCNLQGLCGSFTSVCLNFLRVNVGLNVCA